MRRILKDRLVNSSSSLILVSLVAATSMVVGVSAASAQDAAAVKTAPPATSSTGAAAVPPANPIGSATATDSNASRSASIIDSTHVGEVVVTARLKEENIQKVPETIVAITPQVLQNNQITNFYQLQGFAPSVDVSTGWIKDYTGVLIRGFGTSTFFSEVPAAPSSLYDMSGVQILYGPQGTLFGYTALGGAVLYTPAHPDMNNWGAGADLTLGNLNTTNFQGYVNIPLIKDQLALRVSAARNRTDGYIHIQGRSEKLDSNDNQSVRIGLQYNSPGGGFTDYTMLQLSYQNDTATAEAVSFYNSLGGYSSLTGKTPTGIPLPGPNFIGGGGQPAFFGYACSPATLAQVWAPGTTMAQCETQHAALLGTFQQQALAAVALTQASGGYQIPAPIENAPLNDPIHNNILVNIANLDVVKWTGALGGGSLSFHNVADVTWFNNVVTNFTVGAFDYYGSPDGNGAFGTKLILPTPRPSTLTPGSVTPPSDGFGAPSEAGYNVLYHDEFQIHGTLDDALGSSPGLSYVLGFYNSIEPSSPTSGFKTSQNIPISFNGAYAFNEGPAPSYFYVNKFKGSFFGQYINVIADAGALFKPLTGLQFTGGVRFNQNRNTYSYYNYSTGYTSPNVFYRTTPVPPSQVTSVYTNYPVNYSAAVNYITSTNDVYFNFSHIIVPGFANNALLPGVAPDEVPGYVPFAKPENLNDYELGDKYRFDFGGVRGYLDVDLYYERFTDVQIAETVFIPSLNGGTYVAYTGNPADEERKGIEIQGEVFPTPRLDIYANFSYADDHYTRYLAPDPTSLFQATAGYVGSYSIAPGAANSPLCVPGASAATVPAGQTTGSCIFDFKKSPLPFAPKFQTSVRASYTFPLKGNLGDLVANVTANYISREFFQGGYSNIPLVREEQLLGPGVAAAESSAAHTLVNLRLQWNKPLGHDNFSVAAFATNIGDVRYADGSLDFLFATGVATQDFGPPREFGVELSAKW